MFLTFKCVFSFMVTEINFEFDSFCKIDFIIKSEVECNIWIYVYIV
jgi:hypothetical protein